MLEGLPAVEGRELRQLQGICLEMLGLPPPPGRPKFPGSQPVSFGREHLAWLRTRRYWCAEKTDGVRYMLLILGARDAFMVDRKFGMRSLPPMHFPSSTVGTPLDRTLLDGELVEDTTPGGPRLRYLVYDACVVNGRRVTGEHLNTRLGWAGQEVLAPRGAHAGPDEPFAVEIKDFKELQHLQRGVFANIERRTANGAYHYVFRDPNRNLAHGNDGVVFTPVDEPYTFFTCRTLLKWKPADMNTVDFKLRTEWRPEKGKSALQPRFQLLMGNHPGQSKHYGWIYFPDELRDRFANDRTADARIIECVWDKDYVTEAFELDAETWDEPNITRGGWRFERLRPDKTEPNFVTTVENVWRTILEDVTKDDLLAAAPPQA